MLGSCQLMHLCLHQVLVVAADPAGPEQAGHHHQEDRKTTVM
jgi:hypothetical protein